MRGFQACASRLSGNNPTCKVVLTGFVLFFVFLFVLVPLTAEEKGELRSLSTSTSKPRSTAFRCEASLQDLCRKEVVSNALEIGSDVRINKKAHTRKGKLKAEG